MTNQIIPYPGLRPFTEEEAIFFKGRDLHIKQIITQLQDKKIIIVTGASGAGKSSLVFAGVIPNARAGFFKALFNRWAVVIFRPEKSPLSNLARSLAKQLNINPNDTYNQLQYGFSALVDLYKQSNLYIDPNSEQWSNADPETRRKLRSSGANLLIVADQFEEFFTNPENFPDGKPSIDAYTTVNLLLETATISLRENLPIYVIFTMRSDYISDCIAFKGLPEFIGFSQFFVPRLKRTELQQVIEEPAKLAGGQVSQRLTQVLINQLREGFDQLPILQHTLNLLWKTANFGKEKLDLIHLAKIGGLHKSYLDQNDRKKFDQWFEQLPQSEKKYFSNPSLSNVLNYHANKLFDNAYNYYQNYINYTKTPITQEQAACIIKTTFLALTRIDEGRAVRNRMTLRQITNLINNPKISYQVVNIVINIFREPNATFIHPFIDPDDPETKYLSPDTILDITHESLIRNWQLLQKWEIEEEINLSDFLEFKVQLKRWLDNNKSPEYLLPLGTLTYFENWYQRCKPNKYWIAKYDKSNLSPEEKLKNAHELEKNITLFLKASREHIEAAEKRKKRIRLIAALFALITILTLSGFTIWALKEKRNALIQKHIAEVKKNEAIIANKKAEKERLKAEKEKVRAEREALKALMEKRKADSALKVAIQMSIIAEKQKAIAEQQKNIAQQQALRALIEKRKADSLRKIAEIQRNKAIAASNKAHRLSMLALAQTLAYKATQHYSDNQINLLLAYYAYFINKKFNGPSDDPTIFNGLLSAYLTAYNQKPLKLSSQTIRDIFLLNNKLRFVTDNNQIVDFNLKSFKKTTIKLHRAYRPKYKNIRAVFLDSINIAIQDLANWIYIINTNNKRAYKLISVPNTTNLFAFQDQLYILSRNSITPVQLLSPNFKKIDNQVVFLSPVYIPKNIKFLLFPHNAVNYYYAVSLFGKIIKISSDNKIHTFINPLPHNIDNIVTASYLSPDDSIIFLGRASGLLSAINAFSKDTVFNTSFTNSLVKQITFDPYSKKIIFISPDNTINIISINNISQKPITININNGKIQKIYLKNSVIYTLYQNQTFAIFSTSPEFYAKAVYKKIKRNFSAKEWKLFFGNAVKPFKIK